MHTLLGSERPRRESRKMQGKKMHRVRAAITRRDQIRQRVALRRVFSGLPLLALDSWGIYI